ncbi:hypothetical protein SAMN05444162_2961 [Paenibacillaceae bacterium GAS479]|nr:hypothetical protein SAMN05444162_2961 [Paenibacillaceae bacterium GAS479]
MNRITGISFVAFGLAILLFYSSTGGEVKPSENSSQESYTPAIIRVQFNDVYNFHPKASISQLSEIIATARCSRSTSQSLRETRRS